MRARDDALASVPDFPRDLRGRLRDELSVTSAEQFLDLSSRYPEQIAKLLGIDENCLNELRFIVSGPEASKETEVDQPDAEYPFMTGQDAPPPGGETFVKPEGDERESA